MKMLPGFQRKRHRKGIFAASGLLLLLSTPAIAQSGRRAPKPAETPVSLPKSDSAGSKNNARELKQRVSLLVGREPSSKHLLSEDAIFADFLKHLGDFKNVSYTSMGDIKRDRAVKRAKTETDSPVVVLQFDVDEFQSGTLILNSPDLEVHVYIFEPKTGQKKFEGKVYYKAVGGPMLKKDNWPTGTPVKITTEAVGIEAAEQVRDWFLVQDIQKKN
jgi:hypothetical protein